MNDKLDLPLPHNIIEKIQYYVEGYYRKRHKTQLAKVFVDIHQKNLIGDLVDRWDNGWFAHTDPSNLGFKRDQTGNLKIEISDFKNFMGDEGYKYVSFLDRFIDNSNENPLWDNWFNHDLYDFLLSENIDEDSNDWKLIQYVVLIHIFIYPLHNITTYYSPFKNPKDFIKEYNRNKKEYKGYDNEKLFFHQYVCGCNCLWN